MLVCRGLRSHVVDAAHVSRWQRPTLTFVVVTLCPFSCRRHDRKDCLTCLSVTRPRCRQLSRFPVPSLFLFCFHAFFSHPSYAHACADCLGVGYFPGARCTSFVPTGPLNFSPQKIISYPEISLQVVSSKSASDFVMAWFFHKNGMVSVRLSTFSAYICRVMLPYSHGS